MRGVYGSCCGREGREEAADAPTDKLSSDPQISIDVVFVSVSTTAEIPVNELTELPPDVMGKRRRAGEYLSAAVLPFVLKNVQHVRVIYDFEFVIREFVNSWILHNTHQADMKKIRNAFAMSTILIKSLLPKFFLKFNVRSRLRNPGLFCRLRTKNFRSLVFKLRSTTFRGKSMSY